MGRFVITSQGIIEANYAGAEKAFVDLANATAAYVVDSKGAISVLIMDKGIKINDAVGMVDAVKSANGSAIIKTTASFAAGGSVTPLVAGGLLLGYLQERLQAY